MTLFLQLANFDAGKDIRSFMAHAFDEIYKKHHMIADDVQHPWPPTDELDKLLEKASGLFIFATTVIKFVDSKHQDPRARLHIILNDANRSTSSGDTTYADLDFLYHDAIRTINDADLAQLVLGVVRHVSNPLSIRALSRILSPLHIINVAHIFPDLGSVLVIPEDPEDEKQPVRIYHASFGDFISSRRRAKCYFVDPDVYHPLLARLCLEHMCVTLKTDMCDIGDPSKLNSEVDDLTQKCSERINETTRYACLQWSYHLTRVPTTVAMAGDLMKFLVEFSRKSILHWVETLSLLGAMDSVITTLRDAIAWLKLVPTPPEDTLTLFKDTQRLALMFFDAISQSSLHVYHSALPLTPTNTLLRKYFQTELTGKFVVIRGLDPNWGGRVRTIDVGDVVHSVAFSPNDDVIASASAKHGAQLWNATTGVNIVTLGPLQMPSTPICFSPAGDCVALAFESGFVAVWDTPTAQPIIYDEECHRQPVTALEFSPNNITLASASRDKSIQLWQVETGKTLYRLQHDDSVLCLAFSIDSKIIVSGCQGGVCLTWDVESGQLLRKLRGHSESVNAVAVSGDGVFIASGSDDKAVRVWDSKTGGCIRTYVKGLDSESVRYVRFTPDNSRVISVCPRYICSRPLSSHKSFDILWSVNEYAKQYFSQVPMWIGKMLKFIPTRLVEFTFQGTYNIGFSSNSGSVALALEETMIYSTSFLIRNKPPSFITFGKPTSLALSSDGSQVALGDHHGTIQLWDPSLALKSWSEISNYFHTQAENITSSPNGNRHIISQHNTQFLVDPRTEVIKKLSGSTFDAGAHYLFSENSCIFACWSFPHLSLRVYKSSTGDRIFRVFLANIGKVALSPDGTLISCEHRKLENVLEVWDVSSGKRLHKFPQDLISCIYFAQDNSKIACGTSSGRVHLWDLCTGDSLAVIGHGTDKITCLAFSPDGNRLGYGCEDGSLQFCYPLPTGLRHTLILGSKESPDPPALVLFSSDGTTINYCTIEGTFYAVKVPSELVLSNQSDNVSIPSSVQCDICRFTTNQTPSSTGSPSDYVANPHVKFMSDKTSVRDYTLRSDYEIRFDGWVYDGDRRTLWLPPPFRPSTSSALKVSGDMLTIKTSTSGVLFIDLAPMNYYRKRDVAP